MPEQEVSAEFPALGVHVACEFSRQPAGTTPAGVNVRALDQLTDRLRGGSRPGITPLVPETVNGDALIQHLTVLVDPTVDALDADDDDPLPGTTLDDSTNNLRLRNPGRYYRTGGSARQPNRGRPAASGVGLTQVSPEYADKPSGDLTVTFSDRPTTGGYLVVAVLSGRVDEEAFVTPGLATGVTNGAGADYECVSGDPAYEAAAQKSYDVDPAPDVNLAYVSARLQVFVKAVGNTADDQTVVVANAGDRPTSFQVLAMEFHGAASIAPVFDFDKAASDTPAFAYACGPVDTDAATGQLVLGVWADWGAVMPSAEVLFTESAGWSQVLQGGSIPGGGEGSLQPPHLSVFQKRNVIGPAPVTATVESDASNPFQAIAIVLKR